MTYPDGTTATGFLNGNSADPRNSEVYDAGCAADILGNVFIEDYGYVHRSQCNHRNGLYLYRSEYMGNPSFSKDTACPCWADYAAHRPCLPARRRVRTGPGATTSVHGTAFTRAEPVQSGFGKWSVAGFPNIPAEQLYGRAAHKLWACSQRGRPMRTWRHGISGRI